MDSVVASVPIKSEPAEEELLEEQPSEQSNMSDQPTSMANQQEENRSTEPMKLFLSYSTRDQLISCLNLVSIILQSNEPIPEDVKSRTCEKIEESIGLLTKLLPSKPTAFVDQSATFEERIAEQLTLELSFAEQPQLMNHLLANRNTVLFSNKFTDEARSSLIVANKRIVVRLMEVPPEEPMANAARSANDGEDENTGEPPSKRQRSG